MSHDNKLTITMNGKATTR